MTRLTRGKDVLLFYKKHKWDYVENFSNKSISGFYAWYTRLVLALKEQGCTVHENNYELARSNPRFPIGLVGTPDSLTEYNLPNPAILGPCMYDNPKQNPTLMQDSRFRYYLLTSEWFKNVFEKTYGEKCKLWFAGIPLKEWVDTRGHTKTVDILIYDKIRWGRDSILPVFLHGITQHLKSLNLSYSVLKYGEIKHEIYKEFLGKSKAMIFLCESETQGMAYQEALASNVPVLAWDPGWWVDPIWLMYSTTPIPASSVPYFGSNCGEKFDDVDNFAATFAKFWDNLSKYSPRKFVEENLSLKKSAEIYLEYYLSI